MFWSLCLIVYYELIVSFKFIKLGTMGVGWTAGWSPLYSTGALLFSLMLCLSNFDSIVLQANV